MLQKPDYYTGSEALSINTPTPEVFSLFLWERAEIDKYLEIYRTVGEKYNWCDRLFLDSEILEGILSNPDTQILLLVHTPETWDSVTDAGIYLRDVGIVAGFCEFNIEKKEETEIVYFGLCDGFSGRKVGMPFLQGVVNYAWNRGINRLWLHTCDLDHPAALPMYLRAGFKEYDRTQISQPVK